MTELTITRSQLVPIADTEQLPAPKVIDGVAREVIPAAKPRDFGYAIKARRKIAVAGNIW